MQSKPTDQQESTVSRVRPAVAATIRGSESVSMSLHSHAIPNVRYLSRSTSAASFSFLVCTSRIAFLPSLSGRGHCTMRSNRPDRSRAGSRSSNLSTADMRDRHGGQRWRNWLSQGIEA